MKHKTTKLIQRLSLILLVLGLSSAFTHAESTNGDAKPYNVLFIALDDMNTEVGCYDSTTAITPNIDRLAERGTVFRYAYAQQAVCNPSRASLMTGMRPDTLRIWDLRTHFRDTHPNAVTLPQLFKNHGYHAQGIGKLYHNWGKLTVEGDPGSWSVPQTYHYAPHYSDWYIPGAPQGTPAETQNGPTQCEDVPDETYFDGRIAQEAIEALNKHKDKPFFLAVGFWKPHLPFNAPKQYWDLYDPEAIPGPQPTTPPTDGVQIAQHNFRELRGYAGMPKEGQPTPEQVRELRHGYYAAVSFVDAQVGKVIDELDRLRLAENTIVVLWSDHGFHLGEHALWAKTSNFEKDAGVPLIISAPGKTRGQRCVAMAELLDIYPTLAELCGLQAPDYLEGRSLASLLDNADADRDRVAITQHPRPPYYKADAGPTVMGYSLRTPRYRYTEWRDWRTGEPVAIELYDHNNDPHESVNLAGRDGMQPEIEKLASHLAETAPRAAH